MGERARDGKARPVAVAFGPDEAGFENIRPQNIE